MLNVFLHQYYHAFLYFRMLTQWIMVVDLHKLN